MQCELCGKEFNIPRGKPKCLVCKRIYCNECRPFKQSSICIEHFNEIPENNRSKFIDSSLNIQNRMRNIGLMSFFITFIGGTVLLVLIFVLFGGFERYLGFVYGIGFASVGFIARILILKKQKVNILKLWKELTGNFDI